MAAAHSSPRPAGAAEVQLHTANGAAEPEVRMGIFAMAVLFCGWANFYIVQSREHGCLSLEALLLRYSRSLFLIHKLH